MDIRQKIYTGERVLFQGHDLQICDSIFMDGESPLKESSDIKLEGCLFRWKYPLWYSNHIDAQNCTWFETARAGMWYTNHIKVRDSVLEAPKSFRRCQDVMLERVNLPKASETLWHCGQVTMREVTAAGDYFAMNSHDMVLEDFSLTGNYCFDGARNVVLRRAKLLSKDAFWNTEDVTVYDSFISGEYLGWNAKNLTLIRCTVESLQGLCYIDHLVMKDCKLLNTTLAFEYSTVDVTAQGAIQSIKNPKGGIIRADSIGEVILEEDKINTAETTIVTTADGMED